MVLHEVGRDLAVAFGSLHAIGRHGIVTDEQEGSRGDMVGKATGEERGGLHIHRHGAGLAKILLEVVVVLPHAAVGGIYGTGPVVVTEVANGRGHGTLHHEGRQCGHFGGIVVVAGSLAAYAGNGQDEVALLRLGTDASALTEEEACLGTYRGEQIHDYGGIGRAHAEVYHRDVLCRSATHIGAVVGMGNAVVVTEYVHIVVEVGQQDVLAEVFECSVGVSRQPVLNDFLLCLHRLCRFVCLQNYRNLANLV